MKQSITMPALSSSMEHGTLVRWLVQEGAEVKAGESLAEIETDKAVLTLEAPADGKISKILVSDGTESVKVGCPLAYLDQGDETRAKNEISLPVRTAAQTDRNLRTDNSCEPMSAPAQARVLASPLARRLAREFRLELASVHGSGPGGRILGCDVTRLRPTEDQTGSAHSRPHRMHSTPASSVSSTPDCERVPLTAMRRSIAERMLASKQTIPHAYLTVDIYMDALIRFREELNQQGDESFSLNDFMIKGMAIALAQSSKVNVQFCGDHLLKFHKVDLAVAVAIEDGLMTPVIQNAGGKPLREISLEMRDLSARARERKLRPEEYCGGTACLSNLGMMGIKQFEAIISPPHSIILAIGAVERRAAVVDERLSVVSQLTATASFDHRAMDGRDCAEFLTRFKAIMERPTDLFD